MLVDDLRCIALADPAVPHAVRVDGDGGALAASTHARRARELDVAGAPGSPHASAERIEKADSAAVDANGVGADEDALPARSVRVQESRCLSVEQRVTRAI